MRALFTPLASPADRSQNEPVLYRSRHRSPERPRARPASPGHVHRHQSAQSPRPRSRRQQRRRGARRPLQPHRPDRLQGRLDRGGRRRPRHAGRHPPEGKGERGRADPHAAARGRQVFGRLRLQVLRRPARRRRLGGQRALEAPRVLGPSRRQGIQHLVQEREGPHQARGRGRRRQEQHGHHRPFLARPRLLRQPRHLRAQAQARAEGEGRAVPRAAHALPSREDGREGRVALHRGPGAIPG